MTSKFRLKRITKADETESNDNDVAMEVDAEELKPSEISNEAGKN